MGDYRDKLVQLGLQQYHESFVEEGFDTWESLLDITEADLESLNVKRGHRRKLQRAIAEARGLDPEKALPNTVRRQSIDASYNSDDSFQDPPSASNRQSGANANTSGTKRKYRRHPKVDENAPERPASAYVIFSNQIRAEVKGADLSFTEIAKTVGERWQVLDPSIRERYEKKAGLAKEKYYADLSAYKRTEEYAQYQQYLADFKAKHGLPTEGKRAKLEPQNTMSSLSTQSSRGESLDMGTEQSGSTIPDQLRRVESSPSTHPQPRTTVGPQSSSSLSVSPASHSISITSPISREPYSPLTATYPPSNYAPYELPHHNRSTGILDSRKLDVTSSAMGNGQGMLQSAAEHPGLFNRRPLGLDLRTPTLSHNDTTISSDGSIAGSIPMSGSLLPVLDAPKEHRVLPQPVPTATGSTPNPPMSAHLPLARGPIRLSNERSAGEGHWSALLRAGEQARDADVDLDQRHQT